MLPSSVSLCNAATCASRMRQPMANADKLAVRLEVPNGWRLTSPTDLRASSATQAVGQWKLDERHAATIDACRSSGGVVDRLRGC